MSSLMTTCNSTSKTYSSTQYVLMSISNQEVGSAFSVLPMDIIGRIARVAECLKGEDLIKEIDKMNFKFPGLAMSFQQKIVDSIEKLNF